MEIPVSDIPDEGLEVSFDQEAGDLEWSESGVGLEGPVHTDLRLERLEERVMVSGETRAVVTLQCSRCLAPYTLPVRSVYRMQYAPIGKSPREELLELHREDLDVAYYHGNLLPVNDMIRGQILLALPMRPLCDPGCAGLCSVCGAPRAEGCGCPAVEPKASNKDEGAQPFAVLSRFLDRKG